MRDTSRFSASGEGTVFPALASRGDLPPRVRDLLERLLALACEHFEPAFQAAIEGIEQGLFKLAERAPDSQRQQVCFDAMREVKGGRADAIPRFLQHLEGDLARLRTALPLVAAMKERPTLQLLDSAELDEDLALRGLATRAEVRNREGLAALALRMGVLGAAPEFEVEALPLGPARITQALRHSLAHMNLASSERVLAFRQFETRVLHQIAGFYAQANRLLASEGVLPHHEQRAGARGPQRARSGPAAPAPTLDARSAPPPGAVDGDTPATRTRAVAAASGAHDPQLFSALQELLHQQRRRSGEPAPLATTRAAAVEDLDRVLANLQRNPQQVAGHDSLHLRNLLAVRLRRVERDGVPLGLAGEAADTVDLLGMLFDYMAREAPPNSATGRLLEALHIPLLRVALADRGFFTAPDHPARELLNTIAEIGTRWGDVAEGDAQLGETLHQTIARVNQGFDEKGVAVFQETLQGLVHKIDALERRAELAERRQVDAAKGRERLSQAHRAAGAVIGSALAAGNASEPVRALLESAWGDALAMSALRQGENSGEFAQRSAAARALVLRGNQPLGTQAGDRMLLQVLEAGLRQVGLHSNEVRDLLAHLMPSGEPATSMKSRARDRAETLLASRPRFGREARGQPTPEAPQKSLDAEEQAMLARVRELPFGTWFQFVRNQQGEVERRKLAWFSTLSGRCLFVNARGNRVGELALEQLARALVGGQVRLVREEPGSLVDRAWKAIMDRLRGNTTVGVEA